MTTAQASSAAFQAAVASAVAAQIQKDVEPHSVVVTAVTPEGTTGVELSYQVRLARPIEPLFSPYLLPN